MNYVLDIVLLTIVLGVGLFILIDIYRSVCSLVSKSKNKETSKYVTPVSPSERGCTPAGDVKLTSRIADDGTTQPAGDPTEPTKRSKPRLSKAVIDKRLYDLAKSTAPNVEPRMAMCYAIASIPRETAYVCPACGAKTIYALETPGETIEQCKVLDVIKDIDWFIDSYRQQVSEIEGITVEFDESQLCKRCSPNIERPELGWVITYSDGMAHRVRGVEITDLVILKAFLAGEETVDLGDQKPLKDYINRLEELLGVKVDLPDPDGR